MVWIKNKQGHMDRIRVTVRRIDGSIKSDHYLNDGLIHKFLMKLHLVHNTMTSVGFAAAAGLLINVGSITPFGYIGIGTGVTGATVSDTQLQIPVKIKAASTLTRIESFYPNDTAEFIVTFSNALDGLTGTDAITEIAIFNGTINGTSLMLLHQVYSPADSVNFDQGDTITITVTDQMKQG